MLPVAFLHFCFTPAIAIYCYRYSLLRNSDLVASILMSTVLNQNTSSVSEVQMALTCYHSSIYPILIVYFYIISIPIVPSFPEMIAIFIC